MPTSTSTEDREVFVPAAELAVLFAEAAELLRERSGHLLRMAGHQCVTLLLAELPGRELFWLVTPLHEGSFLAILPWSERGKALLDVTDEYWPEHQRWHILARQPITLVAPAGDRNG